MTSQPWCARVIGEERGAGFLIDRRRMLTCEHVSGPKGSRVRVWFPARDHHVNAEVVFSSTEGDLAILHLDGDIDIRPAPLAPFSAIDVHSDDKLPELTAVGYPDGYETDGASASFRPAPGVHQPGGVVQVLRSNLETKSLAPGFSGAAAFLHNGRLAGMVTKCDRDGYGTILPLRSILHHWPELDDLACLGDVFGVAAYRELRAALEQVDLPGEPLTLLLTMLRRRQAPPAARLVFPTVLSVVEYVATEMSRPADEVAMMVIELLQLTGGQLPGTWPRLRDWIINHALPPGEQPPEASGPGKRTDGSEGSVIVRIARSGTGDMYDVALLEVDRSGQLKATAECGPVARADIQDRVEEKLELIFAAVSPDEHRLFFIEFAVPPNWQTEPVEQWRARYDGDVPLGWSNPLMVRDLAKFDEDSMILRKNWETLRNGGAPVLAWRHCHGPSSVDSFRAWLRQSPRPLVVGLAGLSAEPLLGKAAEVGVPVMLWSRDTCEDHANGSGRSDCRGTAFRVEVAEALAGRALDTFPEQVRQMRLNAAQSDDPTRCGHAIVLSWDDPQRRPADTNIGLGR